MKERGKGSALGGRILVVEDDRELLRFLTEGLSTEGYAVKACGCAREATAALCAGGFDVCLMDLRLPDSHGLELFRWVRERHPECAVLMMTSDGTVETAVEAMRMGALDYIEKPFPLGALLPKLRFVLEEKQLAVEVQPLRQEATARNLVARSVKMRRLLREVAAVAPTDATVLILGESGTGKELVADLIHASSRRRTGPLVKVNSGAISDTLVESELFGHEKGAFTGAERRRIGALEAATRGTLFLDEVGEISLSLQVKLLRALQERKVRRLGAESETLTDFRLIAATNRSLQELLKSGGLREDFYFRLNVFPLVVPPLRERLEDIAPLVEHFVAAFSAAHGTAPLRLHSDAAEGLLHYPWPGNVREVQNTIERLQILHPGKVLTVRQLPPEFGFRKTFEPGVFDVMPTHLPLHEAVSQFERRLLESALDESGGNKTVAARQLGISRKNLWEKLLKPKVSSL